MGRRWVAPKGHYERHNPSHDAPAEQQVHSEDRSDIGRSSGLSDYERKEVHRAGQNDGQQCDTRSELTASSYHRHLLTLHLP